MKTIFEIKKERDDFLREHPELRSLQAKIDSKMSGAVSQHNRMVIIHDMMMDSSRLLQEKLDELIVQLDILAALKKNV